MEQKIFNYFKKCVLKIANIKYPEKRNKYGKECVAINGEYKKKNVTSISLICDQNCLPLSSHCIPINRTIYNGRHTSQHEVKNVQKTLNNINLSVMDYVNVNLIGDRG